MTSRHWSTRTVAPREQFAFWREAVCEAVLNVATEHPGDGFSGDITCSNYGDLRFAAFASTPHEVVRRTSHIGRSRNAHYLVSLQRRGASRMFQGEDVCELQPGDVGLVDGTRPFRVEFPERVDRVVAVIPHVMLHSRAPWLDRRPLNRMAGDSALSGALRFYLERLAGPDCSSDAEAAALTDNLCNIIALMTATTGRDRAAARHLSIQPGLDEMLVMLRRHLADPDLSPRMLAERLQLSVRTVHKRFEDAETTFGQWVLDARLQACRRALDDPRQSAFTISQIAFGWGFNDLSHFSKAFKTRFGLPPAQYRRKMHGKIDRYAGNNSDA
jgi:AraC family transcriptional regulator, positive regulator of tynA and feaB